MPLVPTSPPLPAFTPIVPPLPTSSVPADSDSEEEDIGIDITHDVNSSIIVEEKTDDFVYASDLVGDIPDATSAAVTDATSDSESSSATSSSDAATASVKSDSGFKQSIQIAKRTTPRNHSGSSSATTTTITTTTSITTTAPQTDRKKSDAEIKKNTEEGCVPKL